MWFLTDLFLRQFGPLEPDSTFEPLPNSKERAPLTIWLSDLIPFLVATAIFLVPGSLVTYAGGFRGLGALALAPLITASILAVSAVAAPLVGLSWSILPVLIGTCLVAIATITIRKSVERKGDRRSPIRLSYRFSVSASCGLLIAALVLLYRLIHIFGDPEFVSQTADNVFHLNAVRYILQTANASSLTVGGLGSGTPSLYPALWHGTAALIVQVTGASIPASVSALNLVIGALVWPASAWFLVRVLFGNSWAVNLGFGVLAAAFGAFPYLLVDWGVLYPNYLGMALLPAAIALGVLLTQARRVRPGGRIVVLWFLLMAVAGLVLAHPNTLLCAIVVLGPLWASRATTYLVGSWKHSARMVKPALLTSMACLAIVATVVVWIKLRPFPFTSFNITWPPYQTSGQAIGEAFATTFSAGVVGWATAILMVVGLRISLRGTEHRWMAWSFLWWVLLFIAVTAWQPSVIRAFLTGGWFDDFRRIAAGMVVVELPLALLGFIAVVNASTRFFRRFARSARTRGVASVVPVFGLAVVVLVIAQTGMVQGAAKHAKTNYSLGPGSPIMSSDELALYKELPSLVPAGEVIADNPWDGSAWAYFVSGRRVLFPAILTGIGADNGLLAAKLNQAASDPEVCAAANRLHVRYAINSDELIYLPGNPANQLFQGIAGLDRAPGFELVAKVGANRLYRLTACG